METSWNGLLIALFSGLVGAVLAQIPGNWDRRRMQIRHTKLEGLRKIAGNRAAAAEHPILDQAPRCFEGLNEVMVVFSHSKDVSAALNEYKGALRTPNGNDKLIALFRAICRNAGIDVSAFNDSLFLQPFTPAPKETKQQ